jgi:hypothetical protein
MFINHILDYHPKSMTGKLGQKSMNSRTKIVVAGILGFLVFFFIVPTTNVNVSGQVTFLGSPFASMPTTCNDPLGCYCVGRESLSEYFLHFGFGMFRWP